MKVIIHNDLGICSSYDLPIIPRIGDEIDFFDYKYNPDGKPRIPHEVIRHYFDSKIIVERVVFELCSDSVHVYTKKQHE